MSSSSTDANDNIDDITEDLGGAIISEDKDKNKGDIDTKADNDDSIECSLCGWGQTEKICISCEQKMEKAMNNDTSRNNNTDTCSIEQDIYDHIVRVSTTLDKCAACGKEGDSDEMNTCNKCKSVKYCNAACKKKHRKKHKKACERRVAELHDEKLFADPPKTEECPICMLPLPFDLIHIQFQNCCGKRICIGCILGIVTSNAKNIEDKICPYCRTPASTTEEEDAKRTKKLMENGNYRAISTFASSCAAEGRGTQQDIQKAKELWLQAGKLGSADAYNNLGTLYHFGHGVEVDKKKAKHYWELAAIMGSVLARRRLGSEEGQASNIQRANKHMMIAAKAGDKECLDVIKTAFMKFGSVTKDDYESTLRCYHERQKEMKSDSRDKGAQIYDAIA